MNFMVHFVVYSKNSKELNGLKGKEEPELLTKEGQAERVERMAEGLGKGRKVRMGKELSICEDLSVVRSQIT